MSDWRVEKPAAQKLKKNGKGAPVLRLVENPDILARIAGRGNDRPALVVGFAAETENVVANARDKRARKGCDWILANDVSPATGVFGGDRNTIHLVDGDSVEDWPVLTKQEVARSLDWKCFLIMWGGAILALSSVYFFIRIETLF